MPTKNLRRRALTLSSSDVDNAAKQDAKHEAQQQEQVASPDENAEQQGKQHQQQNDENGKENLVTRGNNDPNDGETESENDSEHVAGNDEIREGDDAGKPTTKDTPTGQAPTTPQENAIETAKEGTGDQSSKPDQKESSDSHQAVEETKKNQTKDTSENKTELPTNPTSQQDPIKQTDKKDNAQTKEREQNDQEIKGEGDKPKNSDNKPPKKGHHDHPTKHTPKKSTGRDSSHAPHQRPPMPPQESSGVFLDTENCSSKIGMMGKLSCRTSNLVHQHVIFFSVLTLCLFLLCCWRKLCGFSCFKKRDERGEYRAVAAQYGGFNDDTFNDEFSLSFTDNRSQGSFLSDDDIEDDWSSGPKKGVAVEMSSLEKEVNGGLTLEEMNG